MVLVVHDQNHTPGAFEENKIILNKKIKWYIDENIKWYKDKIKNKIILNKKIK